MAFWIHAPATKFRGRGETVGRGGWAYHGPRRARVAHYTVADHMSSDVFTLLETDPLRTAVEQELSHHIRHFPVVDPGGRLVGILTDRDIKRALPTPLSHPSPQEVEEVLDGTQVGRLMTRDPDTVTSSTPIAEAVRRMLDRKIGCLPVVEGGRLMGVFTRGDALRAYLRTLES
jgi:CBS domain-containing protein